MSAAPAENRSPAFVPLTLAVLVLALSAAFTAIAMRSLPALHGARFDPAQWLGSIGLPVGCVLVVACALTDRRGVPARPWACVLAALVLLFGLGLAWSMLEMPWLASLARRLDPRALVAWTDGLGAAKSLLVALVALPLAWRLGGRDAAPVQWTSRQRRILGALAALCLGAGVALLVQTLAAAFTALGDSEQRVGMSVVALGVGAVHGLAALIAPMRRGAGTLPALVSALLTPALIVLGSLPAMFAGEHWNLPARVIVVLVVLLLAPALSWLLVRRWHGAGPRTGKPG
ncbi:hypothetical protein SAMN04487939_13914 [Lysobacter sp. yr284]|uniref:hypothetical protein n=1 Tax=Lysobacter sp. yr284 TaxID=1761791 RepID=UPI000895D910|nr:hypothetical protein [Lysobacter sp. yr284]SDZ31604.1 hypothetical protein SAMN04487939_13914 [Lysobacter sp. yr284]